MKETELRIGNWVKLKDVHTTNEWQVEGLGNLQQVAGQLWSIEELEPIPLTEEWLERFGFEKKTFFQYSYEFPHVNGREMKAWVYDRIWCITIEDYGLGFFGRRISRTKKPNHWIFEEREGLRSIGKEISKGVFESVIYVHNLQNLYFALTGEELQSADNEHDNND